MKKTVLVIVGILFLIPLKVNAINTSASSAILMDMDTKRIMYSKDIHNVRSVASISKIMTAILAIESGKLDKTVTIKNEIDESYGSGIYIKHDEKMKLKDLVYGLLLRSGNDAALSIAVNVSGSKESFIKLMNEKAKKIGMKNTVFNNPSGLDKESGNYSTSYDMALLMSYCYKNKVFRQITGTKKYTLKTNKNVYVWHNKNKLLNSYKYCTGGKTGFTEKARRTLVTTATHNNLNLVVVTLNDGNDWVDHKNLFEYGFANYYNYKILDKKKFKVKNEKYYKDYKLYIKQDYYYPIKQGEEQNLLVKIKLQKIRNVKNGKQVGYAYVYVADNMKYKRPIYIKVNKKRKIKIW